MALKGPTSCRFLFATFLVFNLSLFFQLIVPSSIPTGLADGHYTRHVDVPEILLVEQVQDDVVERVYVDNLLALDVVQQPDGDANYVSPNLGEVTQFSTVSQYGNIGLLAHNYLSGREFSHFALGQQVDLLYSSGRTESFVITEILRYQALQPRSPYSSFQNLDNHDEVLSVGQMFERAYGGEHHITFQTCIARYGTSSWGRLFIVAVPVLPDAESQASAFDTIQ